MFRAPGRTTGELLMMIAAYATFLGSSASFGSILQHLLAIAPRFRRARVLLDAVPEVDGSKADPGELSGQIDIRHLSFRYGEGAPLVLDDVSLTISPGQFVAFVGASGSGKSTMLKLLLGFEQPVSGVIFYDSQDLKKFDVRAVRRQLGVVLQSGRLMSGTIAENILGVSGGSADMAWQAALQVGLTDDIEEMPMGMHTVVTDAASTLSGGQVQRLVIARALVGDPRVLFLDEATSAPDNRTHAIVTQSLERMAVTRVVIAHRLSTIKSADCIFVFAGGASFNPGDLPSCSPSRGHLPN